MCFVNVKHHKPPHFHVLSFSIPEGNLSFFFLRAFLICLAPMLIKDIHNSQSDAVVVLQADLVGQLETSVGVEHPCADGTQRILVT